MALNNPDPYERKQNLEHLMPKAMPAAMDHQSDLARLTERVERLLELLEPPSAVIITGKRAVEEYQALINRGA